MSALTTIRQDDAHVALVTLTLQVLHQVNWRHHGIGVLQGYLSEHREPEIRIHVWDPALIKPGIVGNGDVHDHRFDMVSHVLAGNVAHEEWFALPQADGTHTTTLLTHARAAAETKFHGPTTPTAERFLCRRETYVIPAGHRYTFPARAFHRSPVPSPAVTLVEKHNQRSEPARILHPYDAPFVAAFGHDECPSLLVTVLDRAKVALEKVLA